jgi:mannose-6-phosphate isomerase
MSLYPLKFVPRPVEKIWGGRELETVLGKSLPEGKLVGESWEIYDFPPGVVDKSSDWVSSVVANGSLAGRMLHSVVEEFGGDLHGEVPLLAGGQFPILIKFLDAREDLSLQVHPPRAYAAAHPGAHLKTEAWYVVENKPGAKIYRGLRPGVTREQFRAGLADGSVMGLVNAIEVKPGQCYFLPSGTVHSLGAGILVAEVQTPSDTTFRVWDFNRLENGKPRKLHVGEALECIDFSGTTEPKQKRAHTVSFFTAVTRLVTSEHFVVEKVRFSEGFENPVPYDQPAVWVVLEGEAEVSVGGQREATRFGKGDTVLLPARMRDPVLRTLSDCVWLEVTFPTRPELA